MRRKIPKTRKHKKLKFVDPCYSGPLRQAFKKNALPNEPPKEEEMDDQEVPSKMQQLFDSKNQAKNNRFKKRKKKKPKKDDFIMVKRDKMDGMSNTRGYPDIVKQQMGESNARFFDRLQNLADSAIAEANIEQKYNVDIVDLDNQGIAHFKPSQQEASSSKKREKRKKFQERKKQKANVEEVEEYKIDVVKFGEVVLEPPRLTVQPKYADKNKAPNKDLVLNKKFETNAAKEASVVNKKKKRKLLDQDEREKLENEQVRVIDLYRAMKKKQRSK